MDHSPPGSSVHGISQARVLEWVAISFCRESSWPRDQTHICIVGGFFICWAIREPGYSPHPVQWLNEWMNEWMNHRPIKGLWYWNEHHVAHVIILGETIQGLRANLTSAIETLCGVDSSVAVSSGGELFLRFISLTSLEYSVSPALPRSRLCFCVWPQVFSAWPRSSPSPHVALFFFFS